MGADLQLSWDCSLGIALAKENHLTKVRALSRTAPHPGHEDPTLSPQLRISQLQNCTGVHWDLRWGGITVQLLPLSAQPSSLPSFPQLLSFSFPHSLRYSLMHTLLTDQHLGICSPRTYLRQQGMNTTSGRKGGWAVSWWGRSEHWLKYSEWQQGEGEVWAEKGRFWVIKEIFGGRIF